VVIQFIFGASLILTFLANTIAFANNPAVSAPNYHNGLFYQKHNSANSSRGVVILTHGILEHSGRYDHLVTKLNTQGYTVYSYDLRGHGQSYGIRGHISNFDSYVDDLNRMVRLVQDDPELKNVPIYLFGHSMGGLIVYLYVNKFQVSGVIEGVVLSAPGINIPLTFIQNAKIKLAAVLRHILPHQYSGESIDRSLLTDDLEMIRKHREDKLILPDFTFSLGVELIKASDEAKQFVLKNNELPPIFFIQGDRDTIIDAKSNIQTAKLITSEENILIVENGLHESLNSKLEVREGIMAKIVQFLHSN